MLVDIKINMQIRKKIFETNSSSTHSLVIESGTDYVMPLNLGDKITIKFRDFYSDDMVYCSFKDKAELCYNYARTSSDEGEKVKMLKRVIEHFTKTDVVFEDRDDMPCYCTISGEVSEFDMVRLR